MPRGYHPVSAPPGYDSYYLNVMAGPVRTWKFHNDPEHEWLFPNSGDMPQGGREPMSNGSVSRAGRGWISSHRPACIDLNANEIHRPMEETMTFTKYVGGSPANITVGWPGSGAKPGFIGKIANDRLAGSFRRYLRRTASTRPA